ncbi:transcriptional adapter 2A isoform X1 [Scaptodrosophila lebanonensis]|uniref:Transcriptional adapter n=1 Tax=Drosophila lebanonensis TaxID=7225 RepID=A0A6J2THJ7_DROLE|nr:transcriptional adapter 2A isoform X1 [Scaptodrosophila lebanonensis]
MSFMNPVDTVDEDAADLQFPKAEQPNVGRSSIKIARARIDKKTKLSTTFYNAETLNKQLTSLEQNAPENNESGKCLYGEDLPCATCHSSLSEPYIRCSECLDILLCLQCFARGRENGTHRNYHAYVVVRDDIQIFPGEPDWTARDERILLQTLRTQGYGNWEAVARALEQRHTKAECRRHYHDCYFGGIFERLLGLKHARQCYLPERMPYVVKMRSLEPPRHDDITSMQFKINAGYRCARGDFDTPYDGSAEGILSVILNQERVTSMASNEEDEEIFDKDLDEELQCALVRAYNHRLRERHRRYKIMRLNGLIMPNRTVGWISKYAHAFRSDTNCMRFLAFVQICNPMDFDMLVESLNYYRELQSRLNRLYDLRQQGIRTLYGGSLYMRLNKQRQQAQREYARQRQYNAQDWQQLVQHYETNRTMENLPEGISSKIYMLNARRKAGPMEITDLPGYTQLNEEERSLCSVARLVPQAYLEYKAQLIAENSKFGYLRLADARRLIKIDVNKTRQIYDFLLEHGHISRPQTYS